MTRERYEGLMKWSRRLHGHQTVLPVAVWIHEGDVTVTTPPEAVQGLLGRADKARVIEALEKLDGICAVREMPRNGARNATRYFEKLPTSVYWTFLEGYLAEIGLENGETAGAAT
jgi:hypothetical protein